MFAKEEGCGKERNCLGSPAEPEHLSASLSGRDARRGGQGVLGMQINMDETERSVNPN